MAIYDTEEEQLEALKRWWKENSQAVIIGLITGIGIILGTDYWRSHQHEKRTQAAAVYEKLTVADGQGQKEQVEKLAQELRLQYESTPYAGFAGLFQAKNKVQQGDIPAAKAILEKLVNDTSDSTIKNVAKLRLISLMLATGEYEQGLKKIAENNPADVKSFSGNYEELKGDLYVALNRPDEARTAYEAAQRDGAQSPLLQFKLDDLTALPVSPPPMSAAAPTTTPAATTPATPVKPAEK